MQNFLVRGGGRLCGVNKVHYGLCKNGELRLVELVNSVFQGEESVKEARRLLEFAEETVYVSRPLVGESNKKQTVREVGCKVNACRTKFQNWIRRSQISYC